MNIRRFTLTVLAVMLPVSPPARGSADADYKKSKPLVIDGKHDLTISGLEIA
jgi:hypothetical protein